MMMNPLSTLARSADASRQPAGCDTIGNTPQEWSFTNTIVAANPSHQHPDENLFWKEVAAWTHERGWNFVQLAMRSIPEIDFAHTLCIPARLWHLNRMRENLKNRTRMQLPWIGNEYFHLMEDFEHRRWGLDATNPDIYHNAIALAHWVDYAFTTLQPAVVLTCNKIDHCPSLFHHAAKYFGSLTALVERSPFDDVWVEPDGLFGESHIWSDYGDIPDEDLPLYRTIGRKVVKHLTRNPFGFRHGEGGTHGKTEGLIAGLKHPVVFLPMDNALWTGWEQPDHPQGFNDYYDFYPDPIDAVTGINQVVRNMGGTLIVKNHPSCHYINKETISDDVVFHDGNLAQLLELSDAVVTFNTKVAFPALAMGKPVVSLSPNPVAAGQCTYHCNRREVIPETIQAALDRQDLDMKLANFVPFCGWLASRYFYSCNESTSFPQKTPRDLVNQCIDACGGVREINDTEISHVMWNLDSLNGRKGPKPAVTPDEGFLKLLKEAQELPVYQTRCTSSIGKFHNISEIDPPPREKPGNSSGPARETGPILQNARRLLDLENTEDALHETYDLLSDMPNTTEGWIIAGQCHAFDRNFGKAVAAGRQACLIEPENVDGLSCLIEWLIRDQQHEEAIPFVERLIELSPESIGKIPVDLWLSTRSLHEQNLMEGYVGLNTRILNLLNNLASDSPERQKLLNSMLLDGSLKKDRTVAGLQDHVKKLQDHVKKLQDHVKKLQDAIQKDKQAKQFLPKNAKNLNEKIRTLNNQVVSLKKKIGQLSNPDHFIRSRLNTLDARIYWKLRCLIYHSTLWPRLHRIFEALLSLFLGKSLGQRLTDGVFSSSRSQKFRKRFKESKSANSR